MKHFPTMNCVRLFDDTWNVSQQWTCVTVPWTVDYLDTKFQLTVTKKGPLVAVLSQPNQRYFRGLQGRYSYALHFRLYKAGDEERGRYIVRSMHKSGDEVEYTRSLSAELDDVEPGNYTVIFKVTADREPDDDTAEDTILDYAIDRKEKLLTVGRRFDYAQTKGNLRAMEKSLHKAARQAKKQAYHSEQRLKRWKKQKEKQRMALRAQRINEAKQDGEDEMWHKIRKYRLKKEGKKPRNKSNRQKEDLEKQFMEILAAPGKLSKAVGATEQRPNSLMAERSGNGNNKGSMDVAVETMAANFKRMGIRSPKTLISPASQISPRTVRPGRAKELASSLAKVDTEYEKEKKGKSEESWSITDLDPELNAVLDDIDGLKEHVKEHAATHFKDDDFAWKSDMYVLSI